MLCLRDSQLLERKHGGFRPVRRQLLLRLLRTPYQLPRRAHPLE